MQFESLSCEGKRETMSSAVRGMVIRTPAEVHSHSQRVSLKGKYAEQYDQLVKESRTGFLQGFSWCGRVGHSGHYWDAINMDPKLKRNEQPQVRGRPRAQAILSPVSDPSAPTTKKVLLTGVTSFAFIMLSHLYLTFFVSFIYLIFLSFTGFFVCLFDFGLD